MKDLSRISAIQLYMIYREINAMDEDGQFINQDISYEYTELIRILRNEFSKRGYITGLMIEDYFGSVYKEPNRRNY